MYLLISIKSVAILILISMLSQKYKNLRNPLIGTINADDGSVAN